MKKYFPLFAVMLLLSTLACNKPQDDTSPDNPFSLKCKIDGHDFASEIVLMSVGGKLTKKGEYYGISGTDKDGNGISFWLEGPLEEGTFVTQHLVLGQETYIRYQQVSPFQAWTTTEGNGLGTITIEKNLATYVEGTFSFTGINPVDGTQKVFTSGSFKVQKL